MRQREENLFKWKHQILNQDDLAPALLLLTGMFDYIEQPWSIIMFLKSLPEKGGR